MDMLAQERKRPGARGPVQVAVLLGLALFLVYTVFSGNLKNYTDTQFGWLVLAAAGMLALLGLAGGYSMFRARAHLAEGDHDEHEHHNHGRASWPVIAVVALPLLLGVLVPSKPLGAGSMNGNVAAANPAFDMVPPSISDPGKWNILDWQRAYNHQAHPLAWFNGQKADVVGFVDYPQGFPSDHLVLARWVMYHCALDARGVGLLTVWNAANAIPVNTWARIKGTIRIVPFAGEDVLTLYADSVDTTVGEPDYPYLRPYAFTP